MVFSHRLISAIVEMGLSSKNGFPSWLNASRKVFAPPPLPPRWRSPAGLRGLREGFRPGFLPGIATGYLSDFYLAAQHSLRDSASVGYHFSLTFTLIDRRQLPARATSWTSCFSSGSIHAGAVVPTLRNREAR